MVLYTILLIAFGVYGTGEGDYLHYKENVEVFHTLYDVVYYNGMEIQYNYLAYLVGGNYTLWRLVVFSVQFIGMSWLLYKAKLNTYPVFLSFITICLIYYTYQRSYWGVIFYFMGLYLFLERKKTLFLIVISLCVVSHTQNILLLALFPLGFLKIKKWQLLLVLLLIGVLAVELKDYLTAYLDSRGGIENAEYVDDKIRNYGEGGTNFIGGSIGEIVLFMLRYVPITIIVLKCVNIIFTRRNEYLSLYKPYRAAINVTIGLVITSLIILFASIGAGIFFYRILAMTLFPVSLLLPYIAEIKIISKKSLGVYFRIFILVAEISYIKDLYYAYAHGM